MAISKGHSEDKLYYFKIEYKRWRHIELRQTDYDKLGQVDSASNLKRIRADK